MRGSSTADTSTSATRSNCSNKHLQSSPTVTRVEALEAGCVPAADEKPLHRVGSSKRVRHPDGQARCRSRGSTTSANGRERLRGPLWEIEKLNGGSRSRVGPEMHSPTWASPT